MQNYHLARMKSTCNFIAMNNTQNFEYLLIKPSNNRKVLHQVLKLKQRAVEKRIANGK